MEPDPRYCGVAIVLFGVVLVIAAGSLAWLLGVT
jgi:hypothetical protein